MDGRSVLGLSITIESEDDGASRTVEGIRYSGEVGLSGRDCAIPNEAGAVVDGGVKAEAVPIITAAAAAPSTLS